MKNWDPAYYDTYCILQYKTAMEMLTNFTFNQHDIVLDIGSGSGKITHQIAKLIPHGHATGLDISRNMVDFSRKKYQANNLNFEHCDILDMHYNNQFDVIVSFWTLSWVEDQSLAFANMIKALKPNGRLLIMYPMRHDAYDVAAELIKQSQWQEYFKGDFKLRPFMTKEQYRRTCHSAQMEISVTHKKIPCHFSSTTEMQASIQSWMSHLDLLPTNELKQTFLDDKNKFFSIFGVPSAFFFFLQI